MDSIFEKAAYMRQALEAVPSMVLVVDDDGRIFYYNKAAAPVLRGEKIYSNRAGEVMSCIHSTDSPGGCGRGPHCSGCVVRNSVKSAFAGESVIRAATDVTVKISGQERTFPLMVSASTFSLEGVKYAIVVLEDISELVELRALLPICCSCKKIRSESGEWERVETYIGHHMPQNRLTHGLCPDCARKLYQ